MGISPESKATVQVPGTIESGIERDPGPQCLVVMYHYVRDRDSIETLSPKSPIRGFHGPTTKEFRAQIELLCRTMEPIDWPTLYAWQRGLGSIPARCFLLSFDDGLADHARNAVPVLDEFGLRGVFFVPAEVLTTNRLLSAHAIHLLLSRLDEETFERELMVEIDRRDSACANQCRSVDENLARSMYHYELPQRARLKYLLTVVLPVDIRIACLQTLFDRHVGSSLRWARNWYLNWEDLASMQSSGHTIGGHGYSHEPLPRLTPAQQRSELRRLAVVLREGLGHDLRPLSYPYGSFDEDTVQACCGAGFAHAFTTQKRWAHRGEDVFRIPRFDTIDVAEALEMENLCRTE